MRIKDQIKKKSCESISTEELIISQNFFLSGELLESDYIISIGTLTVSSKPNNSLTGKLFWFYNLLCVPVLRRGHVEYLNSLLDVAL